MKLPLIAFLIVIFPFHFYAQEDFNSQDFPSFKSVQKHFYENYNAPESGESLYFEKRPEGYFVAMSFEYPYEVRKKREMLWSYETKSFQKLKSYFSGSADPNNLNRIRRSTSNTHEFDFCPFAGYPGWQREVIKLYEEKENLPDTLMYGLARAYSTFAANFVYDYSNNQDMEYKFDLPKSKNAMTEGQLKTYRKYAHLARETFLKLHQQNPNFETIVGKIYTKYCAEVMWNFLLIQYYQNDEEARKELVPNLYNDFYINTAKNYLASCPPNAILFTYGDNDTYPLLYVQAQLGFRTDVLIANLSLLALGRYIDHIRGGVFDAPACPFPFDPEFYANDKNNLIIVQQSYNGDIYIDFNQVILDLKNEKNLHPTMDGQGISTILSSYLYLEIDKEKIIENKVIPEAIHSSIVDSMKWNLLPKMILKNDLAVLGIIAENNWKRPICMGATARRENFLGMNDYFHLEGLIYRLLPVKSSNSSINLHGGINAEESYKKIISEFNWKGINHMEAGRKTYYQTYLVLFSEISNQFIDQNKLEKAEIILDKFFEVFPNQIKAYDSSLSMLTEQYFLLGKNEKAEKIGLQIIENFLQKNQPTSFEVQLIQNLIGQAEKYKNQKMLDALKKINW